MLLNSLKLDCLFEINAVQFDLDIETTGGDVYFVRCEREVELIETTLSGLQK